MEVIKIKIGYRTRANKGRDYHLKFFISTLRLSHEKRIKNIFQHDFLGGWPLIESNHYCRKYGTSLNYVGNCDLKGKLGKK